MGNTGSAHNVHLEDVSSELNALYHSQQLRRAGKRQQQQHQLQWTYSLPHMMATAADSETSVATPASALAQIKVLPQLSERLKLRTTTNGAILHSGGTISGRREQQLMREAHKPLALQERSRTFIDEPKAKWDGNSAHQVPKSLPAFRRAQTVLHLDYSSTYRNNISLNGSSNNRSNKSNSSAIHNHKYSDSATEQTHRINVPPLLPAAAQAKTATPTLPSQSRSGTVSAQTNNGVKLNKYNKKRKAPAVPLIAITKSAIATKNSTAVGAAATVPATPPLKRTPNMNLTTATTKATATTVTTTASSDTTTVAKGLLTKTRLFRTNAVKSTNIQQQQQQSPYHHQPLRQLQQQHQSSRSAITESNAAPSKLGPYRREKSSDAILIRQFSKLPRKVLTRTLSGSGAGKYKSVTAPPIATTAPEAPVQASRNNEVGAATISKTSQLNRTFYFGMGVACGKQDEGHAEVTPATTPVAITITKPAVTGEISSAAVAAAADAISSYKLSMSPEAKAIVDNGLLVHVRPTLPRRQLDTPSFSPVTAWRTLVEEQQRLHKQNISNNVQSTYLPVVPSGNKIDLFPHVTVDDTNNVGVPALKEPPIQLHKVEAQTTLLFSAQRSAAAQLAATWTPQQDLEEEDDDDNDVDYGNDNDEDDDDNDGEDVDRTGGLEKKREDGKADGYDVDNGRGNNADDKNEVNLVDIAAATVTHYSGHRKCLKDVETHHEIAADSQKCGRIKEQRAASTKSPNRSAAHAVSRMHVFSLSLPRDAHIQAHLKNRLQATGLRKDDMCGFSSLQKLKYNNNASGNCCCLEVSAARNLLSDTDEELAAIVADATSQCVVHSNDASVNYRSDNWVLHKTKSTSSLAIASAVRYPQHALANNPAFAATTKPTWDALASVEPISLTYVTAGKHVIYLPGKEENKSEGHDCHDPHATANKRNARTANNSQKRDEESMQQQRPPPKQQTQRRQRRTRPVRESLQDADSVDKHRHMICGGTSNVDKSQRFSFQSTVRLLEKRRLAEKLAKDAEIREEQRKSELEAMKRVEEDFQRKRASEKANIRNQLRLYFSGADECSDSMRQRQPQYMSFPVFSNKQGQQQLQPHYEQQQQHPHDSNNNIACRDDPDGAVSPPSSPSYVDALGDEMNVVTQSYKPLQRRYDSDCGESDVELEMVANFKRSASLVEPYLQSIIK